MTVLGVAVGVSLFVSLTSISAGFKSQLQDIVRGYSIDIVVTSKGAATPSGSRISSAEYAALLKTEGIRNLSSVIMGPIKPAWNPYFLLIGISSFESFASKLGIVEGRVFMPGKKEVLLGAAVAEKLGFHVNEQITLAGEETYTITGIYMSGGRTFDGGAIVDLQDARRILKRDAQSTWPLSRSAEDGTRKKWRKKLIRTSQDYPRFEEENLRRNPVDQSH